MMSHLFLPPRAVSQNTSGIPFVGARNMARLVRALGPEDFLIDLANRIEDDFRRWPEFDKSPRVANHSSGGVIELMPVADRQQYAFKYVNGHPGNTVGGLQTVVAMGLLANLQTGYPLLMSEMTILTALRTAATSAMVARRLACSGSRRLAIIGNGAQCEWQALAMKALCGVTDVRLYDVEPAASAKASRNLSRSGLNVEVCCSVETALDTVDIVTTCTADKRLARILSDNLVGAGMHLNAIGGDCPGKTELAPEILSRASVFVEYSPQTRIEGEIQQMPPDFLVTEFWQVLTGAAEGRTSHDQITVFDGVGFAIEDFSALRYVNELVTAHPEFSEPLDLLPDLQDPRDLFGLILQA